MGQTQRTVRRMVGCLSPERTYHRGRDIGARAPVVGHRQIDQVLARRNLDRLERDQPVRQDRDLRDPGRRCDDAQLRRLADPISGLVERERELVGRGQNIGGRIPSRVEAHRRRGIGAISPLGDQLIFAPGDRRGDLDRPRAQIGHPIGHARAPGDRLPVPGPVERVPLITRLDPVQNPMHLGRHRRSIGPQRDQREPRLGILGQIAVEHRLDADNWIGGQHEPGFGALDRTARAFLHPHGKPRLERTGTALARIGQGRGDQGRAAHIGLLGVEHHRRRIEGLIVAREGVTRETGQVLGRRQPHLALGLKARARRAEEIARGEVDLRNVTRRQNAIGQGQVEVDPLGQKILDQQFGRGERRRLRIGENIEPPGAARGLGGNREGGGGATRARLWRDLAGILDAIGAHQHGGQRQTGKRAGRAIAGEYRRIHRLARAIGAAVGGQEKVDRRRGRQPLDTPVGQIELGLGPRQERHVIALGHADQRGRRGPTSGGQARVEMGHAFGIGRRGADHRIRPVYQLDRNTATRARIRQAAHDHAQTIRPGIARQAEIRDHEPLRRGRIVIGLGARDTRLKRIDPGAKRARHLLHRQPGGHVAVDLKAHIGRPLPDLLGELVGEILGLPVIERAGEIIVAHRRDQVPVGNTVEHEVEMLGIHRLDRKPGIRRPRQDIGAAREAHGGRPVADIGGDGDILAQRLAPSRGQALAEGHLIALAVLETRNAKLIVLGLDREPRLGQLHEARIFDPTPRQVLGEDRAEAGGESVGLDLIVSDAEAVVFDRPVQRLGDILARRQIGGAAQGGDHEAGALVAFERPGERGQRLGLDLRRLGAQDGIERRRNRLAPLRIAAGAQKIGIGRPLIGRIAEHQKRALKPQHRILIAPRARLRERLSDLLRGGAIDDMAPPEPGREVVGFVEIARLEEVERGLAILRPRDRTRRRAHHEAREGALKLGHLLEIGFRKTRIVARVEGRPLTRRIGQTGSLTRSEGRVEDLRQIAPRQIAVLDHHHAPLGDRRLLLRGGGEGRQTGRGDQNTQSKTTHPNSPH